MRRDAPPLDSASPVPRDGAPALKSLDRFAQAKLADLEGAALRRHLAETDRLEGPAVLRDGRRVISFCCNDYLNFSQHPELKRAAAAAIARYGTGAGASRLVTGNHSLYRELEGRLARLKDSEAACVFGSGYLTNLAVIPSLVGGGDLLLLDELSHACIHAGARLARARSMRFRHNDLQHLEELLATHRGAHPRALVATDGVFSMDGDLAPLAELAALAQRFDAWLLSDDAHGLGVVGGGRGSAFVESGSAGGSPAPSPLPIPLQMGTLSKAVGSYGGYLCASRPVIELMRNRARPLVYSTGLPPAAVAASIAALDLIRRDPDYAARPLRRARRFSAALGLPEAQSCIVPVVLGDAARALAASAALLSHGYLVAAIRPPTVPPGTARLRFTFTAAHRDTDVDRVAEIVRREVL